MKRFHHFSSVVFVTLISVLFVACSEDSVNPEVSVAEGTVNYFTESMNFPSTGGTKILNFTSNVKWSIKVSGTQSSASWCTVSQSDGGAGTYNIVVTVAENAGYEDRNVVLVFAAGDITKNVIVNQKQNKAITLTTDRFEIGAEGGKIDIEVKANVEYSVEVPAQYQSWISRYSNTRAMTSSKLSFLIAESKEYDKREGEIIFTYGDMTERVKVYQTGSAIIILSKNEYTIGSEGGTVSIDISSNFEFEVDMPDVNWLKAADRTRAVSSHTLTYQVSENVTYDDREAVIVIKDAKSDKKESVTIKQRHKDAIILSDNKVEMGQDGGVFSVDVNSNVDYSIEIPSYCSSWISKTSTSTTRALAKSVQSFNVSVSEELNKREGEIRFKYGNITETLKVYQSGGAVLVLTKDTYNLEGGASTINVELKSNIEYTVTTSVDWITEVTTRALSSSTKKFNVSTNKTGKSRTGKITFKTTDGKKTATVTITQATVIEAKSLSIEFTNTSGTLGGRLYIGKNYGFSVSVSPSNAATNYEWKVEDPRIATITGNGNKATLSTKDYGTSKVIVTEKNSGISQSYEFGTCVTDFQFAETSRENMYGYPVIKIAIGTQHQLKCTYTPSYATKVFSNLQAFNFKELIPSMNIYAIVTSSSIVDIDENGLMTAKNIGTTIIESNNGYGVSKRGTNDGIFVEVVKEINPYGTIGGYGCVDLGLPSGKLWATTNFGAFSETDYGSYYMWSSSDRVPASWGNKWNTPTRAEFSELINNCLYSWTSRNGVNGYLFTGKNGATMFLPAAGWKGYTEGYGYSNVMQDGDWALYWSSTISSESWEGQAFAFVLSGTSNSLSTNNTYNTTIVAAPIRPISR